MKINNKKELQNIATKRSVDINYKDFVKIYRVYKRVVFFFDN